MKVMTFLCCLFSASAFAQWSSHLALNPDCNYHTEILGNKLILLPIQPGLFPEIYDCTTDQWTSYPQMLELFAGEDYHHLVAGDDVLFFKEYFNTVYIYHSDTDTWSYSMLSNTRNKDASIAVGKKAIVAGGAVFSINNDFACSNKIDVYDSETDQWFVDTLSDNTKQPVLYVFENNLFIGGGWTSHEPYIKNQVDILNLTDYTWTRDTISNYLEYHIEKLNNKLFVCGGRTKQFSRYSSKVDIFDITNHSWSSLTMQRPIKYGEDKITVLNHKLVIYNGNNAIIFDGITETWDSVMVHPGYNCPSGLSDSILIVGDSIFFSNSNCGGRIDIYDTQHNTWFSHELSRKRTWKTAGIFNDKILFMGGETKNTGLVNNVDIYDVSTGAWKVRRFSAKRAGFMTLFQGNQVIVAGGSSETPPNSPPLPYCYGGIDIYNTSTNRFRTYQSSQLGGCYMKGQIIGSKAMFAGGTDFNGYNNTVDIYDFSNSNWDTAYLSEAGYIQSIEKIGNKLFFLGKNYIDIYTDSIPVIAIKTFDKDLPIQVFPNPATDHLSLLIPEGVTLPAAIELSDASGKNLLRMQATEAQSQIPIQQLPAGLYALKITAKEGTTTRKVVKRAE